MRSSIGTREACIVVFDALPSRRAHMMLPWHRASRGAPLPHAGESVLGFVKRLFAAALLLPASACAGSPDSAGGPGLVFVAMVALSGRDLFGGISGFEIGRANTNLQPLMR